MARHAVHLCPALLALVAFQAPVRAADTPADPSAEWAKPVDFRASEDVVFGHKDGLALTLDVLTPERDAKEPARTGIGVILVSSGGWRSSKSNDLSSEIERRQREHWVQGLLRGGYTLFVARHGSAPRYFVPEMVGDMNRAVRFVRANADRFGINAERIGITSGSSGGHLALMAAMTGDPGNAAATDPLDRVSSQVQAVVAWFPPTDLVNWGRPNGYKLIGTLRPKLFEEMFGKITDLEAQLKSISPIYFVTTAAPPLLLIHGDKDQTVPLQQSQLLEAKYSELGLTVKLVVQAGGGHTYWPGIMDQYPGVWEWFDRYLTAPAAR